MVRAVISGYYGFKNFGDEAVLEVLLNHLKSLNIESCVLSGDVEYTQNLYNVKAVKRFDIAKVFNAIKDCDVLISGGGSLLQNVTSSKSLIYYLFIIALAFVLNKKVVIFAQGIGPIRGKFYNFWVKNILKIASYISVRDAISFEQLKMWGLNPDLVCDPVYSLPVHTSQTGTVGVQLRDFQSINLNLLQKLALLVNAKFSDKKIEIFSLQKSQDYNLCKKFADMLLNINRDLNIEIVENDLVQRISSLEYLIGMRFHSLLVAIKAGVRACAINYDIKVENLAKEADIPIISMDFSENAETIYNKLESLEQKNLQEYSNSKQFDWSNFDAVLFRVK